MSTYGSLPLGGGERRVGGMRILGRYAPAVAAATAISLCVMAVVFTARRPAGAAELLFKTPKLKDLLGTFMKDQGAASKDINEMDRYYKGASKKGRVQMLDDISGEFDPINDADSNYGRVIGIKVASRTNPSIPEDMDVSPEEKARVQVRRGVVMLSRKGAGGRSGVRGRGLGGLHGALHVLDIRKFADGVVDADAGRHLGRVRPDQ